MADIVYVVTVVAKGSVTVTMTSAMEEYKSTSLDHMANHKQILGVYRTSQSANRMVEYCYHEFLDTHAGIAAHNLVNGNGGTFSHASILVPGRAEYKWTNEVQLVHP
ncbi:hypothetical protein MMC28_003331 [Mycoblastus sanguinarius]|nr:hypothetical protein [Mycoblastus sanguinarius]